MYAWLPKVVPLAIDGPYATAIRAILAWQQGSIERLHKQLHYVRLIGMCGKCSIATIQIISAFDYTATTDGQTAKPLQYGNRLS